MHLFRPKHSIVHLVVLLSVIKSNNNGNGSHTTAAAKAFQQSSDATPGASAAAARISSHSKSLLPPSITQVPYSKFEKAEQARAFAEIRKSCQGCWSGAMSILGMETQNKVVVNQAAVRNFRLSVKTKGNKGTWTVWNLLKEGDETVVPLQTTPRERPSQFKVAFPGIILRMPCAVTTELPRIVLEIGFWDKQTRRTSVVEYSQQKSNWLSSSSTQVPWCLDETSLVQMKRQPAAGFVGRMRDPCAIAFLPTRPSFHMNDWDWTRWELVRTECVDFVAGQRTKYRLDRDGPTQADLYNRIVQAFDENDSSNFVGVLPNSMLTSIPYRLNPSSSLSDTTRAFFAHAWNGKDLAVVEVEYQGQIAKRAALHSFKKK